MNRRDGVYEAIVFLLGKACVGLQEHTRLDDHSGGITDIPQKTESDHIQIGLSDHMASYLSHPAADRSRKFRGEPRAIHPTTSVSVEPTAHANIAKQQQSPWEARRTWEKTPRRLLAKPVYVYLILFEFFLFYFGRVLNPAPA